MSDLTSSKLTGVDFAALQVRNLEASRQFYTEQLGLAEATDSPPHAVVFRTAPIPFAIREPAVDLDVSPKLGWGVALWFQCERADTLHARLVAYGSRIVQPPYDGPFGRTFTCLDPDGYALTVHGGIG